MKKMDKADRNKNNNQWYAVAGGPSAGKTTLVNELAKLGYKTQPEAVRILLERELAKGKKLEQIQGTAELQKAIYNLQLGMENAAPKNEIVFFDRGLPEGIAYCRFNNLKLEEYSTANRQIFKNRYCKIFFCEQLPFNKDNIRVEDEKAAFELSRLIRAAYADLDYDIIDLPPVEFVADRVKLVLVEIGCKI